VSGTRLFGILYVWDMDGLEVHPKKLKKSLGKACQPKNTKKTRGSSHSRGVTQLYSRNAGVGGVLKRRPSK